MRISMAGLIFASLALHGAEVRFATPPAVKASGHEAEISFALSEPADVEVAVTDAKGKVVRHLAAGVLGGKNAPPEPLKPGLAQTLTWDGKDDQGKAASGGPFKVRVRAGMKPVFGRMLGDSPYTGEVTSMPFRTPVNGLIVDGEGNLYVKMMSHIGSHGNSGLWPWHVRKFDKDGKYLKTILPYPASTDPAKASGMDLLTVPGGAFTPVNKNSLYPVLYLFGNEIGTRLVKDSILFVHSEQRTLRLFKPDGSNELQAIPMFPKETKVNCPHWMDIQAAVSPDGKTAYLASLAGVPYDGKKPSDVDANWPQERVYKLDLANPSSGAQTFFDLELPDFEKQKYWMPSAWDKKSAAQGLDTDAQGNVLVCDLVNQQVVEIAPDGKKRSATKVEWPDRVLVSRKTGDLYVISRAVSRGALAPATLFKISGRGAEAKVVASMKVNAGVQALDESGPKPVLWLAGGGTVMRVEDRGAELAVTHPNILNTDPKAIEFVGYMDVDAEAELVYVTGSKKEIWRYHGESGEGGKIPIQAVDMAIGPEGMIYTWGTGGYQGPIARFTRDFKPAPLGGGGHNFGQLYGRAGRGNSVCGLDVDALGRVFATWGSNACHVRAYDADGKLVAFSRHVAEKGKKGEEQVPAAVTGVSGYGGSIRLDPKGNIYLLQKGVPKDYQAPAGFEKDTAWKATVGTILKFPPEGASASEKVNEGGRRNDPLAFDNTKQMYPGCGPISQWNCAGSCACTKPRFDVDGFGRVYVPNAVTYTVSVRDNANNEIAAFGGYGNFDAQGPQSAEPKPAIPLGWPVAAGASDKYIYVGDCLNHRVVRVDKTWSAEAEVAVK